MALLSGLPMPRMSSPQDAANEQSGSGVRNFLSLMSIIQEGKSDAAKAKIISDEKAAEDAAAKAVQEGFQNIWNKRPMSQADTNAMAGVDNEAFAALASGKRTGKYFKFAMENKADFDKMIEQQKLFQGAAQVQEAFKGAKTQEDYLRIAQENPGLAVGQYTAPFMKLGADYQRQLAEIQQQIQGAKVKVTETHFINKFNDDLPLLANEEPDTFAAISLTRPDPNTMPTSEMVAAVARAKQSALKRAADEKTAAKIKEAEAKSSNTVANVGPGGALVNRKTGEVIYSNPKVDSEGTETTTTTTETEAVEPQTARSGILGIGAREAVEGHGKITVRKTVKSKPATESKATATTTTQTEAIPLPADKSQLKAGQTYNTSRGVATWDGEKFVQ